MTVYKRELTNGGHFLLNPNTSREKLLVCEFGGDTVRLSHKGRTVSERKLVETKSGRHFVYQYIRYNIKGVA